MAKNIFLYKIITHISKKELEYAKCISNYLHDILNTNNIKTPLYLQTQ